MAPWSVIWHTRVHRLLYDNGIPIDSRNAMGINDARGQRIAPGRAGMPLTLPVPLSVNPGGNCPTIRITQLYTRNRHCSGEACQPAVSPSHTGCWPTGTLVGRAQGTGSTSIRPDRDQCSIGDVRLARYNQRYAAGIYGKEVGYTPWAIRQPLGSRRRRAAKKNAHQEQPGERFQLSELVGYPHQPTISTACHNSPPV